MRPITEVGRKEPTRRKARLTTMSDVVKIVLGVAGLLGALSTIGAFVAWLVVPRFLEWLRRELVDPVQEVRHQVAVNSGKSIPPTMLDKISNLNDAVVEIRSSITQLRELIADLSITTARDARSMMKMIPRMRKTEQQQNQIQQKLEDIDDRLGRVEDVLEGTIDHAAQASTAALTTIEAALRASPPIE